MRLVMMFSTVILLVSSARIPLIPEGGSNDSLYHLVCNESSILHVFHYPIKDGRVTDDLVFHPFKLLPAYLTENAIDYMTPMCQRLSIETDGINHEWFISSENFTKPFKVIQQHGNNTDEEIRYNRMKRFVIAKMRSEIQIIESNSDENEE